MKVEIIQGPEGAALYVNDTRVAGPKPWGGGKSIAVFELDGAATDRLRDAIDEFQAVD